jgi:urease accessory protein
MTWRATLNLDYALEAGRTVARYAHEGPLRVLKSLYPEGDATCHNVLVHPPGGLVGGDTLQMALSVAAGAHGLVTTPGATRFYRSEGPSAVQHTTVRLAAGARMEWLPLETLLYSGCEAENTLVMHLEPGAEMMGWDLSCLGLPHAQQAFVAGRFSQHIEMPGHWLERGTIRADDARLLNSPLGLAGRACVGALFFLSGSPLERQRSEDALAQARALLQDSPLRGAAGVSAVNRHVLVLRVLSPHSEEAMACLRQVWSAWRQTLWALPATPPRIWAM